MPVPFVIKRNSRLVMGVGQWLMKFCGYDNLNGLRLLEGRKLEKLGENIDRIA